MPRTNFPLGGGATWTAIDEIIDKLMKASNVEGEIGNVIRLEIERRLGLFAILGLVSIASDYSFPNELVKGPFISCADLVAIRRKKPSEGVTGKHKTKPLL